jgi:dolichyl-phosphate-mannose-protein mannosyltransferase
MLVLTAIAGILRFGSPFFLDFLAHPGTSAPIAAWGVGHDYQSAPGAPKPNAIAPDSPFVFDELYFANDAQDDLKGLDYLDPEPPLAKLIIALGIKLFGFNSFGWRVMSAIFGTALIPLMYLLARQLLAERFFAITTGILTSFDGMTFVQSRIAMIDIFPIFLIVLGYLLFHLHLRADSRARQRATVLLTGAVLGLAMGAKWIALAAFGTVLVILLYRLIRGLTRYDRATGALALLSFTVIPAFFYLITFTRYLTISHSLTGFAPAALSFSPFHFDIGRAVSALVEFHRWTFQYHYNLKADHPFYSPPWSWPYDLRPVPYYYREAGGTSAEIFNLGNPILWWASDIALVLTAVIAILRRSSVAAFIVVAFAAAYFPFWLVPRGLFLYHMFGGLPLMILALALVLTLAREHTFEIPLGERQFRFSTNLAVYAYLATVIVFFIYFYPLWTGLPLPTQAYQGHIWFSLGKPGPNWCLCYWSPPASS